MAILTFPTLRSAGYPVGRDILTQSLINQAVSGKRNVLVEWTYPIYRISLPINGMRSDPTTGLLLNQDWQTFTGFFKQVGGPALPFHWCDTDDNAASAQQIGVGDGATKLFYFSRTLGGYTEPIQDVDTITEVTIAGSPTTSYTTVTDPNWGFVIGIEFGTAPAIGDVIAASFTYNWPCEFENDNLSLSNFAYRFWEAKKIQFVTKKVF